MNRRVPPALYGDYPAQLAYFTRQLADDCWEFTGYITPNGYGQLGRNVGAHRVAWEVANDTPLPVGLVVDHLCHNRDPQCRDNKNCRHRRCVNPAHLEAVSTDVNVMRGKGFGPANAAKDECANGHQFTPKNTYMRPDRYGRICITCRDEVLRKVKAQPGYQERHAARERARRARATSAELRDTA